jgi:hypothetical protein
MKIAMNKFYNNQISDFITSDLFNTGVPTK